MHKTAQEISAKKKLEKQAEKDRINALKTENPDAYLANLYEKRRQIIEKL